jgi:hypothetical protein
MGFEIVSQTVEELPGEDDGSWCDPIYTGSAPALVSLHPTPRHNEERRVIYEVEQIIETTTRITGRPLVQLRLHLEYPWFGLFEVWPRSADVHRRSPRSALLL